MQINLSGKLLDLSSPIVMGIVNITPDSFFKDSRSFSDKKILKTVEKAVCEGAAIIDIGGYSTHPSAENISQEEEFKRLSKALELILKEFSDINISVDTFRSGVARNVVSNYGVSMINDVSGGSLDDAMFETIANLKVAYVLMHMRGTPQTMQEYTNYDNLMAELMQFFNERIDLLRSFGLVDIILDPGFGFAKTLEQNYEMLQKMTYLQEFNCPILAGMSRKSMIYKLLEIEAAEALNGTIAVNMLALVNGASILRVHDVKEAMETIHIYNQYIIN